MTKDPARSRPLSANVKRLMKASRMSPENPDVIKMARNFEARDYVYCDMQGSIFMEAAMKGRPMTEFAPLWMNSQMAGIFDVSFGAAGGMETDRFANLLKIPLLLKTPEKIVDTLYWVDMVVRDQENKAMALYQAMTHLPDGKVPKLLPKELPLELREAAAQMAIDDGEKRRDGKNSAEANAEEGEQEKYPSPFEYHVKPMQEVDLREMEYAYWLGFLYRCECLIHEESSHMVYGAFDEAFMWKYYQEYLKSDLAEKDLAETALTICNDIDHILVTEVWVGQG